MNIEAEAGAFCGPLRLVYDARDRERQGGRSDASTK